VLKCVVKKFHKSKNADENVVSSVFAVRVRKY